MSNLAGIPAHTYYRVRDITNALCGRRIDGLYDEEQGWILEFEDYFWNLASHEEDGNNTLVTFDAEETYEMLETGEKYDLYAPNYRTPLEIDDYVYLNEIAEFFATNFPDGHGYWTVEILFSW